MANKHYKIAVLSGKGGTGKTLVSVNMASVADYSMYIDCDVEEPNGHLFFKPIGLSTKDVCVGVPRVDHSMCNGCRKCVDFCQFNALVYVGNKLKILDELCHSCGGCVLVCPQKALHESKQKIGEIVKGVSNHVAVVTGILNEGETSGVPIIKELLGYANTQMNYTFIDCPPGSACTVMESIKEADYCLIVAEPTLFGVHNLKMVYELVTLFKKPHGVVLNKCIDGQTLAEDFCSKNKINVIGKIPFDEKLGLLNSKALIVANEQEEYREIFNSLLTKITKEIDDEATINLKR